MNLRKLTLWILCLIPPAVALWVWLSALAFVPVPWPDDSAFYFVAKDFFQWPPRWVMIPQAPFEPTYRIFNFNTMPLFPLLIGIGRWFGIDGSFELKIWPLAFWGLSGSLLVGVIFRAGLPWALTLLVALLISLDPALRWASVLIRPESLIGLCGMAIVLGLTLGFPARFRPRKLWDPIAALLALAAYAHFNAIHLLFPVVAFFLFQPRRLFEVGAKTALYLLPWCVTVLIHFDLFTRQMGTQWKRLAVGNDWLSSPNQAVRSLFQSMGSPEPWPEVLMLTGLGLWFLILLALTWGLFFPLIRKVRNRTQEDMSLIPASAWILGAVWLWHTKPEVWFTYYLHIAIWTFAGLALLKLWQTNRKTAWAALTALLVPVTLIFGLTDVTQAVRLGKTQTWNWDAYHSLIDCIDEQLVKLEKDLNHPKPFRVWDPTFPDITVELSKRHPDWEFTRTNDFHDRNNLAILHGYQAEAMVVPEMINYEERHLSGPMSEYPQIRSVWMTWQDYYLNQFWKKSDWKPNRYLCQRGRWQAFLFMKAPKQ